jgi:lipoprotein-releasing system permease protein
VTLASLVPRKIRFEARLAVRHLIAGGGQTALTVSAVAAGVIIVVFVTSLIFGLQHHLTEQLTESISHITIQPREFRPSPSDVGAGRSSAAVSTRVEHRAGQQKPLDNWPAAVAVVQRMPGISLLIPTASGQGFASLGGAPLGVTVIGADPELEDKAVQVSANLIAGHYRGLASQEVVIDAQLAKELDVAVGDRIRLTSSAQATGSFTIAGIYGAELGRGSAYVTLRTGQSLFKLGTAVNAISVKVTDIYAAEQVAERIRTLLPYDAKSWLDLFPNILSVLQAQAATAYLISGFSLIASSFAIASILVVSVLRKAKQIGILKSMGARRTQIRRIFVLEGLGVALMGSLAGAAVGIAVIKGLSLFQLPITHAGQRPQQLFPVAILPQYIALPVLAAIVATIVAAWLPARQAAAMNPVDVMR